MAGFTPEVLHYWGYAGALAKEMGAIEANSANTLVSNIWQTSERTPKAWKWILPARYIDKDLLETDGHQYPNGAWVTFPINKSEWSLVFVQWCKNKEIVHPSIKANPDEPIVFTLWIEFLEEYPLRKMQWETFCKIAK
jgi:hypothetical protein